MATTLRAEGQSRLAPAVTWEEPDCPLCGAADRSMLIEAADPTPHGAGLWFAVATCNACGLAYTCPRPDEDSIAQFYPDDYGPHRSRREKLNGQAPLARLRGRPCVERRILPPRGQCRLLDFGCGGGGYLDRMHRQGWNVVGVDASPAVAEQVRREFGLTVHVGTLPHPELAPESFDVVTMWHSLEHVHRPLSVLRAARQLLAPGGQLLLAAPNIASQPFRWFGPQWFALDLPRHLLHFTPSTIRAMLAEAGYGGIEVRTIRHSDWLRSSARSAAATPHATWWHRALCNKPLSRVVAWLCYITGGADCLFASAVKQ